ncbi:MAG: DNA repair protein RecN [Defluviitaleaceae bacterium]|nr:DNA repair protein RecN [Defluviitaleaceae bacterium]
MILTLSIRNVALIDEVEVTFGPGLNVLTGETGAGKSILVDSINFLLGQRPGRDFVRTGAAFAAVEGIIEVTDPSIILALNGMGIDLAGEGQLLLERTIQAGGKSVCRINGRIVTAGMLKDACAFLVDVHGQHEHQSLLDSNKQMALLDMFCGEELVLYKTALEDLLKQYKENARALKEVQGIGSQRAEQLEIWKFQLSEIEKGELKPDEEEALTARRTRLAAIEKLTTNTNNALYLLYGSEGSALDKISNAKARITELAKLDPTKEKMLINLTEAESQLADVYQELRDYQDELDADPAALDKIESRLDVIYRLKKKYGPTVEDVLKKQTQLAQSLENIENSDVEIKRLQGIVRGLSAEITKLCDAMHSLRAQWGQRISAQIQEVLRDLGMQSAQISIDITKKTAFGPDGNDQVEFLISPNPGEPLKSLKRIASGGEMSRVMLAIKTVLADADRIGTVIFDEVDAGVSGRTAQQVAQKLHGISRNRQILCITHLPQIAAMAHTHFRIEKTTEGQRTVTSVTALEFEQMIAELARLIGGAEITSATYGAALEMKQQARGFNPH